MLSEMGQQTIPVEYAWQLNERHYGALQGLNKADTAAQLGQELVMGWRRSYASRPPCLDLDDPRHPRFDPRYTNLLPSELPCAESLKDTLERLLPYWSTSIAPVIRSGQRAW
jgi:2,3-bisphosphoglycerate-dependent phosphoglycerate mutase